MVTHFFSFLHFLYVQFNKTSQQATGHTQLTSKTRELTLNHSGEAQESGQGWTCWGVFGCWEQIWGAWSLSWWPWSPGWYQPRRKAWIQGVNWIHGHGLTPKVLKREFHIVHTFEFHGMKSFVMLIDGESRIPGWWLLHHVTHAKFGDWWDWRHMACGDSVWVFCDGSVTLLNG